MNCQLKLRKGYQTMSSYILYLPCLPPSRPISRSLSVRRVRYSQYKMLKILGPRSIYYAQANPFKLLFNAVKDFGPQVDVVIFL